MVLFSPASDGFASAFSVKIVGKFAHAPPISDKFRKRPPPGG